MDSLRQMGTYEQWLLKDMLFFKFAYDRDIMDS